MTEQTNQIKPGADQRVETSNSTGPQEFSAGISTIPDNTSLGWVKIYRSISRHWLWKNDAYFKAWIAILLTVNHDADKVLIDGELLECGRGESLNSLATWAGIFGKGWTIQRVRTFLKLLEKDRMIETKGLRKTTRLTVIKYDSYQERQQADNRQLTDSQQTANRQLTTNKNDKNDKNDKNIILPADKPQETSPALDTLPEPESKTPPPAPAPKKTNYIDQIIKAFCDAYQDSRGVDYIITAAGKERAAASKLAAIYKTKHPTAKTEQALEDITEWIKQAIDVNIPFVQNNMTLPIIVSNINQITQTLKNGTYKQPITTSHKRGTTDQELAEALLKNFG